MGTSTQILAVVGILRVILTCFRYGVHLGRTIACGVPSNLTLGNFDCHGDYKSLDERGAHSGNGFSFLNTIGILKVCIFTSSYLHNIILRFLGIQICFYLFIFSYSVHIITTHHYYIHMLYRPGCWGSHIKLYIYFQKYAVLGLTPYENRESMMEQLISTNCWYRYEIVKLCWILKFDRIRKSCIGRISLL